MRPHRALVRLWVSIAFMAAFAFGCGSSGLNRPVSTFEATSDAAGLQRAKVALHSYYFEPNRIVVHAGRPVELTLHNHALLVPHNFTIADQTVQVSRDVGGKRTTRVTFTPGTPGEYTFICHVGSHAKKGMTGVLVVVP